MLRPLLKGYFAVPVVNTILDVIYYTLIWVTYTTILFFMYRRFSDLGYEKKRVKWFLLLLGLTGPPACYFSSKAANMFYYPPARWGVDFFIEQFLHGRFQTYHASLILPIIIFGVFILAFRFRFFQVWDVQFLHLPLGHAITRAGCLIAGCCWGHSVSLDLFGTVYTFRNPVPLYEMIMNAGLYLVLRSLFQRFHLTDRTGVKSGAIAGLYFVGYGLIRLVLELIRKEKIVAYGLTQAQFVMPVFMLVGLGLLLYVYLKYHAAKRR
jgi:prolipoprotein diacylglyceryltransferase